jgi:LPS-assembly lipoprotein
VHSALHLLNRGRQIAGLLLLVSTLLVSACGWHLRGNYQPSPAYRNIAVLSDASPELTRILKRQMSLRGWKQASDDTVVPASIHVHPVSYDRRTLTINSAGQVASYELTAELSADVSHELYGDSSITVTAMRRFDNDVNRVIATATEEAAQKSAIQNELVERLLLRLGALNNPMTHETAQ